MTRVTQKRKVLAWISLFTFYPVLLFVVYRFSAFPPLSLDYLIFVWLGISVSLFPIRIKGVTLFLINSINIATLLIFGWLPEIIVSQIAVLALLLRIGVAKGQMTRYPMNHIMFLICSVVAGFTYFLIDPILPVIPFYQYNILSLFIYLLVYLITNQLMNKFNYTVFYKKERPWFDNYSDPKKLDFFQSRISALFLYAVFLIVEYIRLYSIGLSQFNRSFIRSLL